MLGELITRRGLQVVSVPEAGLELPGPGSINTGAMPTSWRWMGRPLSVTDRLQKGDCGVFTGPWGNHLGSHWPEASAQVPLLWGAASLAPEPGIEYEPLPPAESSLP